MTNKFIEDKVNKIDEWIKNNPKLEEYLIPIEEKTKVKKAYLVLIGMAFVVLWLASGHAAQLICNLIGIIYPSYASIKAIGKHFSF